MPTPRYLPRSWWADSDWRRGGAALVDDDLHRLGNVCHYPGRSSDFGRMSLESLRRNLRGWWAYHVRTRGWSDIGYQAAVAMTVDGPVVVDLRGIGRVPAAHASSSNPRANWHGGATLWVVGNTERLDDQLVDAYRHYRTTVWLERWPSATGVTGHRRVPGASTGCPGDPILALVDDGALTQQPEGGDMVGKIEAPNGEEWNVEHVLSWMMSRLSDLAPWGDYVDRPDGEKQWSLPHAINWLMRRESEQRGQLPRILANQQAIMAAQGVEVDEQALAQQISAVLVPAVIEALPDTGLTEQQVEQASERAVRAVLGSLDDD